MREWISIRVQNRYLPRFQASVHILCRVKKKNKSILGSTAFEHAPSGIDSTCALFDTIASLLLLVSTVLVTKGKTYDIVVGRYDKFGKICR